MVLTDENLLLPLLYALPADIGRVNVTMGFPLRQSLAYTFVERLVELQNHRRRKGDGCTFYHADVAGILAHPYVAECDAALTRTMHEEIVRDRRISVDAAWLGRNELLKRIFTPAATWRELSDYMLDVVAAVARQPYEGDDARQRVEFLAVIAEQVTKLRNSLDECDIDLTAEVYTSLLRRHLQTLRIPFEDLPVETLGNGFPVTGDEQPGGDAIRALPRIHDGNQHALSAVCSFNLESRGIFGSVKLFVEIGKLGTLATTACKCQRKQHHQAQIL